METLAKAISSGSLRGARGNSGVILSQLFRGFTKAIKYPASHAFITENGCDRYFRYNKDLLLDHRKAALQQELAAEARRHEGQ